MFDEIKRWFTDSGALGRILLINLFVFLVLNGVSVFLNLSGHPEQAGQHFLLRILSLPANPGSLLLKPWTLFTYMFTHEDFWHIAFNLLMLYFVGRILVDLLGERRFVFAYLSGGLAGALVFVLAYNLLPLFAGVQNGTLIGASAGVMGVFLATARYFPNFEVYLFGIIRVKLKWLAMFYVLSDFVSLKELSNLGGHLAHLGGAAMGILFASALQKGNDWSIVLESVAALFSSRPSPRSKIKVVHSSFEGLKGKEPKPSLEEEVDRILDKINKSGYNSLSKEEKETLLRASKDE